MENVPDTNELLIWSKDLADAIGIAPPTLRKWSLELEEQGWKFYRDDNDRRAYSQKDFVALRYLKDLLDARRMSFKNACIEVVRRYANSDNNQITPSVLKERTTEITLAAQAQAFQRIDELTLAVQQLTDQVELIVQEQVKNEVKSARELILSEIGEIKQQLNDQNLDLRNQVEILITETRAERHRKKGFWERVFGK